MENTNTNVLTDEQRKALGFDEDNDKKVAKKGPGRPSKKSVVEDSMSAAEIAKQEMIASFGGQTEDTPSDNTPSVSKEVDIEDILSKISIDVNKIEIVDKPSANALKDKSIVINGRPTFEAICNQSGYIAYLQSLKYSDMSSLENSVGGYYAGRQRLYKVIYDKINTTSLGKVDFKTFLQMTSLYDVSSLIYGIYCQTFKTEVEFTVKCPHCDKDTLIKVPNKSLISVKNDEVYQNIEDIISHLSTPDEAMEKAFVNNRTKFVLPISKMVFEMKIPTLYKYLETIGSVKPEKFEELQDILGMLIFIDKVYKLDIAAFVKTGKITYYEIKEKEDKAKIIAELEIDDSVAIKKIIEEETDKYAIEYTIKDMKCRHCSKDISEIPVDMEDITFFRLRQM